MRSYVIFKDQKDREEICKRLNDSGYCFYKDGDMLEVVNGNRYAISVNKETKNVGHSLKGQCYIDNPDKYQLDDVFFRPDKTKPKFKKRYVVLALLVGTIIYKVRG